MAFILLAGYAEDFMASSVYEGLTVGYVLALTQFVMVWCSGSCTCASPTASTTRSPARSSTWPSAATVRRRRPRPRAGRAERSDDRLRRRQRRGDRDLRDRPERSRSASPTGRPSARTSAVGFYAAGRQITGAQNGLAISGDYLSAASFLGIAGLIYVYGFDGFLYSIGFLVAFLTVMFLLAERMRNSGKYTIADVLVLPAARAAGARRGGARARSPSSPST